MPLPENNYTVLLNRPVGICFCFLNRENQVYSERSRISHCSCIDKMTCVSCSNMKFYYIRNGNHTLSQVILPRWTFIDIKKLYLESFHPAHPAKRPMSAPASTSLG